MPVHFAPRPAHTVVQASSLPGPVVPDGFGVSMHFTSASAAELDQMRRGGFRVARTDLTWGAVETQRGVYDFSKWDTLTQELSSEHIRPLYILDYNNPLYDGGLPPHSAEGIAAFASFCRAAAAHFRGDHIIWEMWNEPNGNWFWKPQPDPDRYADLVIPAMQAMRRADPGATIIAPAASGIPLQYLAATFKDGILPLVDGVSVHPYRSGPPESVVPDYAALRKLIDSYSPRRRVPIVCSEWGYNSSTHGVTEQQQAAYMAREYLVDLSCGVDLTVYYDWRDDGDDPTNSEDRFGVVRSDLAPKPAYEEARSLIDLLRGYKFVRRIDLGDPNRWRLEFEKGPSVAYAEWNTSEDSSGTAAMPRVTKLNPIPSPAPTEPGTPLVR